MSRSQRSIPFIALLVAVAASFLFVSTGYTDKLFNQDPEKSLDIERYPNEPLELVDLSVGGHSIKERLTTKFRQSKNSNEGLDSVKFKENDGWFRRISARLRNVSGKTVTGLKAFLYFKPVNAEKLFSMPLARVRQSADKVLKPNAEIVVRVDEQALAMTLDMLKQDGVDADLASVTLSVETVIFASNLQWYRGLLLQPDPANPNRWLPINAKNTTDRQLNHAARPFPVSTAYFQQTVTCKQNSGFIADHCPMTGCFKFTDLAGLRGTTSSQQVNSVCLEINPQIDDPAINCTNQTTHFRLVEDPTCETCDADGDGHQAVSCGGDDCDDSNNAIHPGASENCNNHRDDDCDGDTDFESLQFDCEQMGFSWFPATCTCSPYTPIIVDVLGNGFRLTNSPGGVNFDINNDGQTEHVAWTAGGTDDAFLVLDRNGNGAIDNGTELFGNFTEQPATESPNGFVALAEFDKPANGGNGNSVIDEGDSVFQDLRLWQDSNHNGVSEPQELHSMASLNLVRIHLDYKESKRTDQWGNRFQYRAKVDDAKGTKVNRWAWDVVFVPIQ